VPRRLRLAPNNRGKMNRTFLEVTAAYKATTALSHAQSVTRMYRRALRLLDSWAIDREIFNAEATKIRARFDAHKTLDPRSGVTVRVVREAAEEIAKWAHPDPYVPSYMPGGSRFMRNPALPLKGRACVGGWGGGGGDL